MQEEKRKTTIKDVAIRANTSITTVPRVLSGSGYPVREELKTVIIDTARALSYKPNLFGQLLRGGRNRQVGVVVPSITNPFYSQLITAIQKECMDSDYVPILYSFHNQVQTERSCVSMLIQAQVARVLLSLIHWDESINSALDEAGIPYVPFDQPHDDYDDAAIDFDFCSSSRLAAGYLVENGHRELAFASGPMDRPSRKKLSEGFQDASTGHHMGLKEDNIFVSTASKESGASAMRDCRRNQELGGMVSGRKWIPDSLFAVSDMTAIGIMKQLETHQIHIPRNMSILGFDNVEFDEMIVPALATTSQSAHRTGKLATRLLVECLNDVHTWEKGIILEPVLIEQESIRKTQ